MKIFGAGKYKGCGKGEMTMAEYIEREAANEALSKCVREYPNSFYNGIEVARTAIRKLPAADVAPVVRCQDCVYWQKPQVRQNDGTYRDYFPGEGGSDGLIPGLVTIETGINMGSFCAKYNNHHQNRIPQFMGPDDYCSKGYRAKMEGEGEE